MPVTYSALRSEDYEAVLSLWKTCEGIGLSESDSREQVDRYLQRNPGLCFVARRQGAIVGTILCGHDGRRGYIHHLAVAPQVRQAGIGRTLVHLSLQKLRELQIHKCHIFLYTDNSSGLEFWKRIGWFERPELEIMTCNLL